MSWIRMIKKKMELPISTIDNPGTNVSISFVQIIARTAIGGKFMISNFIDWMVDSLYEFKWLVKILAKWEVNSLKTSVQEIVRRIKKK